MYFGLNLKMMMLAFDPKIEEMGNDRETVFNIEYARQQREGIRDGIKYTKLATCKRMKKTYSKELLNIVGKFENMMDFASEAKGGIESIRTMPFLNAVKVRY
ncbi:hypothetical protein QBC36DRAFT_314069 [Triangularia setosa]|uniref:Uncharacterized protein n=1 Tax=Triangularia setosa TaxID=2587417 RepID=A0AAN7A5J4_9PEZI|nr:hypothetical protein QBC36DRAFT_314069 [Podospora setosa]